MDLVRVFAIVACGIFLAGGIYFMMISDKAINKKYDRDKTDNK